MAAGDVVLWHHALIHGSEPCAAEGTSRKSMALHYAPGALFEGGPHERLAEANGAWLRSPLGAEIRAVQDIRPT